MNLAVGRAKRRKLTKDPARGGRDAGVASTPRDAGRGDLTRLSVRVPPDVKRELRLFAELLDKRQWQVLVEALSALEGHLSREQQRLLRRLRIRRDGA